MTSPRVLFYVQHLLGIGHLARASLVSQALVAEGFKVTMVTGGMPVEGFPRSGIDHVALEPAVTSAEGFSGLQDANGMPLDDAGKRSRTMRLIEIFRSLEPDIVAIEAFPFGRRQMRFELLPFLDAIEETRPKPLVVTSIRDILQVSRKAGREAETVSLIRAHFDRVLVHGDPALVRLEDTFSLAEQIVDRVSYTGLVAPAQPSPTEETFDVIVSAGGGAVGGALIEATLEARARLPDLGRWCIITGPNLDTASFERIAAQASREVSVFRFRKDFPSLLAGARLSISQAGYNTVCDILRAGCRSLLIPFAAGGETEQATRAQKMLDLGLAQVLQEDALSAETLAEAIQAALALKPAIDHPLKLDGAWQSAVLLRELLDARRAAQSA